MNMKNLVFGALTGIGIGIPVALICMICMGGWNETIKEFLVWAVASALLGVLSVFIFKNEKMNLVLATVLHCVGCLIVAVTACTIIGYAESFVELITIVAPIFVVVYVAIYSISFISMKINEKKANEALSRK